MVSFKYLALIIFFAAIDAFGGAVQFSEAQALAYSKLSLACMDQSYPYKSDHVVSSTEDVKTQKYFHPAFYGCFDWHSAAHGHWALLRILDVFPNISNRDEIIKRLESHFEPKIIATEAETFRRDDQKRFERAYGYAWFLRLMIEIRASKLPDQPRWLKALSPLEDVIRSRFLDYLKVFDFPIRRGVHENSAFALAHAFDYANSIHDGVFIDAVKRAALKYYSKDVKCPIAYEPEGDDFISPCLAEAEIMRRVLPNDEFLRWFNKFLPNLKAENEARFLEPLTPTSITDAKAVHLVGLDFYKAWAMTSLGDALPANDPRRALLLASAIRHAATGSDLINKPGYEGTHWLASFAIYYFSGANSKGSARTETATLAGGCFWCMFPPFAKQTGVIQVTAGYTGGTKVNPTYEDVSGHESGHVEAVEIIFDPSQLSYSQLLDRFWKSMDPTDATGQFADRGSQYRSIIFYHDDEQKKIAEESKERLEKSGRFKKKIVTQILPATRFYRAEEYHQDYYKKNPSSFRLYEKGSGREDFLKKIWGNQNDN